MTRKRDNKPAVELRPLFDRQVPHSPESEAAVIGCLLLDPNRLAEVRQMLTAESFYVESNAVLYGEIVRVIDADGSVDLVRLLDSMRARGTLEAAGGVERLSTIADSVPFTSAAGKYAGIVAEKCRRRKLIAACGDAIHGAYHDEELDGCITRASEALAVASNFGGIREVTIADAAKQVLRQIEDGRTTLYPTGIVPFDETFGGIVQRGVNTFVGRSASGKTSLAAQAALNIAAAGVPVRVFSYEMDAVSLGANLLGCEAEAPISAVLRKGNQSGFTSGAQASIREAVEFFHTIDMAFVEEPLTAQQIYDRCALYAARGVRCVVIDYIQALPSDAGDEEQKITKAAYTIQRIHRTLGMCVILVSQITASAARENRPPRITDCLGGQAIEAVTTMGIGTYRPCQWEPKSPDESQHSWDARKRYAEIHVLKQKQGPTGNVAVAFEGAWTKFLDPRADTARVGRDRPDRVATPPSPPAPADEPDDDIPF